jgi:ATP-dependent DNA helicase RecG
MTNVEIIKMISNGESLTLEFKKCQHELSDSVFESVCAFLNRSGGHILLGVTDKGEVIGVNESVIENILKNLANIVNNPQLLNPTSYFTPDIVDVDGKKVICIYVPESSQVHRYKNRIFDRIGDADNDITQNHALIDHLYLRKRNDFTENEVCPFLTIDDLSSSTFEKARHLVSVSNSSHPWLSMGNEELLKSAGLWRKDRNTGKEGYILACALLFGNETTVLTYCPAYRTDAIYRNMSYQQFLRPKSNEPDVRYDDRDYVRVNLIEAYSCLTNFVQKHLPDRFMLDESGIQRIDLRNKIFREIIANILAHREYSSSFPAKFLIFSDLVRTENWSKPLQAGSVTLDNLETHPKNPMIAMIFKELGWVEELGSGKKNIRKYAPVYFQDYQVEISNEEKFVFSITYQKPEIGLKPDLTYQPDESFDAVCKMIGTKLGLSWDQVGTKLGLSWHQVGTKSALSWHQIETLLSFIETSRSIKEIMEVFGWSNRTKFREKYVTPLIETGLIEMSQPDKPKSSKQQYYLSNKGKAFFKQLTLK